MKRKDETKPPTQIWTFGADRPVEGAEIVDEQMRLGHYYRNALARIEMAKQGAIRAVQREHPEIAVQAVAVDEATAAVAEARQAVRDRRGGRCEEPTKPSGKRVVDSDGEEAAVGPLSSKLNDAWRALRKTESIVRKRLDGAIASVPAVVSAKAAHVAAQKKMGPRSPERASVKLAFEEARLAALAPLVDGGAITQADADLYRASPRSKRGWPTTPSGSGRPAASTRAPTA